MNVKLKIAYKRITVIDHVKTGNFMRVFRICAGISLREIARRMKVSAAFLCDLEHGKRNWTQEKFESYKACLKMVK